MYNTKKMLYKINAKGMVLLLIILFACTQNIKAFAHDVIPSSGAAFHVGEYTTICGIAVKVASLNKRTIINIGNDYPNEDIGFLIWNSDLDKFYNRFGNLNSLVGNQICASGNITSYKNHLQIILNNPNRLYIKK